MSHKIELIGVEFASVKVTKATNWILAKIFDKDGLNAITEITCRIPIKRAVEFLSQSVLRLQGKTINDQSEITMMLGLSESVLRSDHPLATAISALRTAIIDIQAQKNNISMTQFLGGTSQSKVAIYANINRFLLERDRSPSAFGNIAERAVRDGFTIIKCAPFDEAYAPHNGSPMMGSVEPGLERVSAVRSAVGPNIEILVDCHSRFDLEISKFVAGKLASMNIGWMEEPVQPMSDVESLIEINEHASIPIAGGESGYGSEFFTQLVETKAVNVVMPDIKWCGGVSEAYRSGLAVTDCGGKISLHGPCSPIAVLAGAHVTAAIPDALPLEFGVYESDWRAELITPPERIEQGSVLLPDSIGLGVTLNDKMVDRYGTRWQQ